LGASKFARLNQDGSIESSFAANLGITPSTTAIAVQADGKVIFAGDFIRVGGVPRVSIARVNADGSLDATLIRAAVSTARYRKLSFNPTGKF
jgi:hypothetical protein